VELKSNAIAEAGYDKIIQEESAVLMTIFDEEENFRNDISRI